MSVFLIILYLLIPVMGLAHVTVPDAGAPEIRSDGTVTNSPCDRCPCNDEEGSRCCDTDFCSCAFHSPPVQGVPLCYDPVIITARPAESFWMLPLVYFSIVVPPQNRFHDRFSDLTEHDTYRCRLQSHYSAAT
jgi:hypothetical protein